MDFSDALRAMKQGHKIHMKAWHAPDAKPGHYRYIELTSPAPGYEEMLVAVRHNGARTLVILGHPHLMAEDWEIYSE